MSAAASSVNPAYMDASRPIHERVADLMEGMTTEEKIKQLWSVYTLPAQEIIDKFSNTSVGAASMHWMTGQWKVNATIEQIQYERNRVQEAVLKSARLKIPVSFQSETLHSGTWGGVVFPAPTGQASSWNRTLWKTIAQAVATEARAIGAGKHPLFYLRLRMHDI